ncbi:hypothetical protein KC678_01565, partial [Candidatus Dojkabacteria bacterium]|nr:hypothetical protein [Candidatus Dojkabacteria bacterium]
KRPDKTDRAILLYLLQHSPDPNYPKYSWGYKDMDESMHPYYYNCPLSFLDMTPVACEEWRQHVRNYHATIAQQKQKAAQVTIGSIVTLTENYGNQTATILGKLKRGWRADIGGKHYRVTPKMIASVD